MKGQTALRGDKLNPPRRDETCNWCEAPAVGSLDIVARVKGKRGGRVPTGMRVYHCGKHRGAAERLVAEPVR